MITGWVICGKKSLASMTQIHCKTEEEARKEYIDNKEFYDEYCPSGVILVPEDRHKAWGSYVTRRLWELAVDVD